MPCHFDYDMVCVYSVGLASDKRHPDSSFYCYTFSALGERVLWSCGRVDWGVEVARDCT